MWYWGFTESCKNCVLNTLYEAAHVLTSVMSLRMLSVELQNMNQVAATLDLLLYMQCLVVRVLMFGDSGGE